MWRPAQLRTGPNATDDYLQPTLMNVGPILPLPGVSAFATASVLVDVPSGRLPGVMVVDNTRNGATAPAGQQLPPTCIAFEAGTSSQAVAALFIIGHHYNDRTVVTATVPGTAAGLTRVNGLGSPLPLSAAAATSANQQPAQRLSSPSRDVHASSTALTLDVAALPQYVLLPAGVTATAFCNSLKW